MPDYLHKTDLNRISRIFDLLDLYRNEYCSKPDAFHRKKGSEWIAFSAKDYIRNVTEISLGLLAIGVKKNTRIATVMVNCPEWNFFDMGLMQIGAVQVQIYPSVSDDYYCHILNEAEIEYLVVSDRQILQRIERFCHTIPYLKEIYSIEHINGARHWAELTSLGRAYLHPEKLETIRNDIHPDDLATIIYTSGTTGRPKGVMLSHHNFISNVKACAAIPDFCQTDRVLSFLPLCHVYERMLNYLYQSFGMSIYYAENLEIIGECIREVRPHTFAAVPRVLEKIYHRIVTQGRNKKEPFKTIFFWALRQGHKFELKPARKRIYTLKLWIANLLVLSAWRKALGGKIKLIISGGASLHPRLARIFWAARIPVMEGYGLTETSPVIAVSTFNPGGMKFGTVGPVLTGVTVKIAPDGEVLCRGPNVMLGYFKRPERTQEVIDNEGWFHTGDIGILEDGVYLRITDRKKEIFKTSTGKYIAPQVIEQKLKESPFIEHVMVLGENRKCTAALIVPHFDFLKNWCTRQNIPYTTQSRIVHNHQVNKRFKQEIERLNIDLGKTEKIKKFKLLTGEWTIASGELSPTLKLRRAFIQEKYRSVIEQMYQSGEYDYKDEEDQ